MNKKEKQARVLTILLREKAINLREASKKTKINKGVLIRDALNPLEKEGIINIERGVLLSRHFKKYKGKKYKGNVIVLNQTLEALRKIAEDHPELLPDMQRKDILKKVVAPEYPRIPFYWFLSPTFLRNVLPYSEKEFLSKITGQLPPLGLVDITGTRWADEPERNVLEAMLGLDITETTALTEFYRACQYFDIFLDRDQQG